MLIVAREDNLVIHYRYGPYCHGGFVVGAYMVMNKLFTDGLIIAMSKYP